ncbi:glycoside hydrolase family 28 protein [Zopfia rhizophila CBS 207.26]|uniref:Glycoside hydrolase family 28 protein n=1 Tax=Zopfia rhizophila CBS 207.26 TaxID=1314779 RepID=A0A6A6EBV5_9PEZI|nr:glycoside hydrolase family 28 protein [Zopfia rhizophila CBS 207.26]
MHPNILRRPSKDDVSAIFTALKRCGEVGRVVLPKNITFQIRTPLDLSLCKACDFQINGLLDISIDWHYWSTQPSVFTISGVQAAVIRSDGNTGIVEANSFGWPVKGTPGTVFEVKDSSGVFFYTMETEGGVWYQFQNSSHMYVWDNMVRPDDACVLLLPGAVNVQVDDVTCITSRDTNLGPSGIGFQLIMGKGVEWVKNVWVKKLEATRRMNVIAFWTGQEGLESQNITISNATFNDVETSGLAKHAVYLEQCRPDQCSQRRAVLNVTGVVFRDFKGITDRASKFDCVSEEDICDFSVDNWGVTEGEDSVAPRGPL